MAGNTDFSLFYEANANHCHLDYLGMKLDFEYRLEQRLPLFYFVSSLLEQHTV